MGLFCYDNSEYVPVQLYICNEHGRHSFSTHGGMLHLLFKYDPYKVPHQENCHHFPATTLIKSHYALVQPYICSEHFRDLFSAQRRVPNP